MSIAHRVGLIARLAIVGLLAAGTVPSAQDTYQRGELVRIRDVKTTVALKIVGLPNELVEANDTGVYIAGVSVVRTLWVLRCLRSYLWSMDRQIGRTVSGLLAGIVFVDWLAVADAPRSVGLVFLALFGLANLFQRFVPAT